MAASMLPTFDIYMISMINVDTFDGNTLFKMTYDARLWSKECWLAKLHLSVTFKAIHISGTTHSKTDTQTHNTAHFPSNLTHIVEVCSIFAIKFIEGQLVIILQGHREKKRWRQSSVYVCVHACIYYMYVCVFNMPKPSDIYSSVCADLSF